jgi:hypothetical protein
MLKIRTEQFEAFQNYSRAQFEKSMVSHLRERFLAETAGLSDDGLLGKVQEGMKQAKCYGIETEAHIRSYLELTMIYGADFDRSPNTPWAGRILRDHRLTADDKIQKLEDCDAFGGGAPA